MLPETIVSLNKLPQYSATLVAKLVERESVSGAMVVAFHGDLGAGKTTLIQQLARDLGVTDTVTSPTFVVMKQYETNHTHFLKLIHIDAYRIETIDEMRPLGFGEILTEPQTLICIEWAERIRELLPNTTIHLTLKRSDDTNRTITYAD